MGICTESDKKVLLLVLFSFRFVGSMFQYEKFFQNTVPPYTNFWLVFGQISAYVWNISSLERKKERER